MKRNLFSRAFLMMGAAVAFTACSNDDVIENGINNGNGEEGVQKIVLQVSNTSGNSVATRGGRPLYSSEAKQDIDKVKVILCNASNEVVWTKTITGWMQGSTSETYDSGNERGRRATIEIPKEEFKLVAGTEYKVYAFGYSDNESESDYTDLTEKIDGITVAQAPEPATTFTPDVTLTIGNGQAGEEIFAGSSTIQSATTTTEDNTAGGASAVVILNRQVAGTFGYLSKIPYVHENGKTGNALRLVASSSHTGLVLGKFANEDYAGNGSSSNTHMYVVNGTGTGVENNVIYTIDLKQWFTSITDVAENEGKGDGLIDAGANWKNPYEGKAKFAEGSVFGGSFLIPFQKTDETVTFKLELYDAENSDKSALRTWNLTLPTGAQTSAYDLFAWSSSENKFPESATSTTDNSTCYNVLRNFLYGIGTRTLDNPTDPGKDPGDKPTPINNKQELELKVNDCWDVIYDMGVE